MADIRIEHQEAFLESIWGTPYEGKLFPGRVKTSASWMQRQFLRAGGRTQAFQELPEMADSPHADKLGIPRQLITFQVMRLTVGTDLQKHGTMKDARQILPRANIQTRGNVYMQKIPTSVMDAINSRTRAILASRKPIPAEMPSRMDPTGSSWKMGFSASA